MWNCTHFRHPTDEHLRHVDIYIFLATNITCSHSTLNCVCEPKCTHQYPNQTAHGNSVHFVAILVMTFHFPGIGWEINELMN